MGGMGGIHVGVIGNFWRMSVRIWVIFFWIGLNLKAEEVRVLRVEGEARIILKSLKGSSCPKGLMKGEKSGRFSEARSKMIRMEERGIFFSRHWEAMGKVSISTRWA